MNRLVPQPDSPRNPTTAASPRESKTVDQLVLESRRLLAARGYEEVIARLEIHRPAEWAAMQLSEMRLLRLLAQAHLALNHLAETRELLEHLRAVQLEKGLLPREEFAAILSDLTRCYLGLGLELLARQCQDEVRRLLHGT